MSVVDRVDRHVKRAALHPGGVDGFVEDHPVRGVALAVVAGVVSRLERLCSRWRTAYRERLWRDVGGHSPHRPLCRPEVDQVAGRAGTGGDATVNVIRSSGRLPLGKRAKKRRGSAGQDAEYERRRLRRGADEQAAREDAGRVTAIGPVFGTRSDSYRAKASRRQVWAKLR